MGLLEDFDLICSGSKGDRTKQDGAAATRPKNVATGATTDVAASRKKASTSKHPASTTRPGEASTLTPIKRMSMAAMQAEVSKYGFRPSKHKATLQQQVRDVRSAIAMPSLHDDQTAQDDAVDDLSAILSSSPSSSALMHRQSPPQSQASACARRRQAIPLSSSDDEGGRDAEMGDLSMALLQEERKAQRARQQRPDQPATNNVQRSGDTSDSSSGAASDADGAEERETFTDDEDGAAVAAVATDGGALGTVSAHVARQLLAAVMSDADLYRRILLFEPISFDEFNSLANRANIEGMRNKETLRNWLDIQCICFYSAELSGSRTRY